MVRELLHKTNLTVISTVSGDGMPESAVIEFGETESLELIFNTLNTSRKYKNLQKNPHVSFVIGWDDKITVQYEGIVSELNGKDLETYQETFFEKNPDAKKWAQVKEISFFKVMPAWIRYSDLNTHPWNVFELKI